MVGAKRKRSDPPNKAPHPLARCLLGSFLTDPPPASSHAQAQRGRRKGRGRGAGGGKAKRRRVRSPSPPPAVTSPEDEGAEAPTADEEAPTADEEALTADEEAPTADEEDGHFIQVEEGKSLYMRVSATLPEEPGLPVEQRPCITPYGESGWKKVGAGERKYRYVNGILGILIRQHYPGMVTLPQEGNVPEPTRTCDHYKACEDVGVANNIEFHNKAERVFAELWASHHNASVPNLFLSYALAHKGPFRSAMPYDENDPPTAYTSMTAYDRMEKFKGKAKELKGPEYDVTTEPLDHALVMISGDGRKHGKEAIAGGMFPRSSCRSLPEYKGRLGISKSSTCQRSTLAMVEMEARLAEERRLQAEERRL